MDYADDNSKRQDPEITIHPALSEAARLISLVNEFGAEDGAILFDAGASLEDGEEYERALANIRAQEYLPVIDDDEDCECEDEHDIVYWSDIRQYQREYVFAPAAIAYYDVNKRMPECADTEATSDGRYIHFAGEVADVYVEVKGAHFIDFTEDIFDLVGDIFTVYHDHE